LGHLVHTRDVIDVAPAYSSSRSEGWVRRAWRVVIEKLSRR
jgi:hypothetical protein